MKRTVVLIKKTIEGTSIQNLRVDDISPENQDFLLIAKFLCFTGKEKVFLLVFSVKIIQMIIRSL